MTNISEQIQLKNLQKVFRTTAEKSGVSFDFLLKTAARESGLQSSAKAKTSSAVGLFQFVEQTWLAMVAKHGASHGLAKEASGIEQDENGRFTVNNQATRNQILGLRHDPAISTDLAAELTIENKNFLQNKLGRAPSNAELYIAHFMGAGQAGSMITAASNTPNSAANLLFPVEAKSNPSIFMGKNGTARTVLQVVTELQRLHSDEAVELPVAVGNSNSFAPITTAWPLAGGMVRAPLLQLSPTLIHLLAELSAPEVHKQNDKK